MTREVGEVEANSNKTRRIMKWAIEKTQEEVENEEIMINNHTCKDNKEDAQVVIEISENEMSATIFIIPPNGGRIPTYEEILEKLKARKIVYGIDYDKIKTVLSKGLFNSTIQIASGKPVKNGENGYVNYFFKTILDLRPKELKNGSVDFYNLDLVNNVKEGELLAEIVPPTKGFHGKTVTGKNIPAKDGKEARIRAGKNIATSEDGHKYFSKIDGQPILHDSKLSVLPILEIKGDVGPATGNINFLGSVIVRGNVKSGFAIKADGDIEINGIVEAAEIVSGGSIKINRGVQGQGKGILKAKNDFSAKYIENATVEAEQNINIFESAMHSFLFAGRKIKLQGKKGLIVGGMAKAGEGLSAKTIGSPMSTYTEIEVGINPNLKKEYRELNIKLQQIDNDLKKIHQAIQVLSRLKDRGSLTDDKKDLYVKLLKTKETLLQQQTNLNSKKEKYDLMFSFSTRSKVSAFNVVYSGVNIIIGNASLKLRDQIKHATFYYYEGQIRFGPYES